MSANRSVQAAQRRRMGQEMSSNNARGPQPSINSSQMFNGQGQQRQMSGKQNYAQQQQIQDPVQQQTDSSNGKMTISQAITLITLRLGVLETKMLNTETNNYGSGIGVGGGDIDKSFLDAIVARLESLEKRPTNLQTTGSATTPALVGDINLLKQQFGAIKNATIQCKNAIVSLTKENKDLRTQMENLRQELDETKSSIENIQNTVVDLNNKFIMMPIMDTNISTNFSELDFGNIEYNPNDLENSQDTYINGDNEIIGTNLKELIEKEINFE